MRLLSTLVTKLESRQVPGVDPRSADAVQAILQSVQSTRRQSPPSEEGGEEPFDEGSSMAADAFGEDEYDPRLDDHNPTSCAVDESGDWEPAKTRRVGRRTDTAAASSSASSRLAKPPSSGQPASHRGPGAAFAAARARKQLAVKKGPLKDSG